MTSGTETTAHLRRYSHALVTPSLPAAWRLPGHGPRTHPGSTARHSARGTGSLQTLPWREVDSNFRFRARLHYGRGLVSRFTWAVWRSGGAA
jgi:hypothetical protein